VRAPASAQTWRSERSFGTNASPTATSGNSGDSGTTGKASADLTARNEGIKGVAKPDVTVRSGNSGDNTDITVNCAAVTVDKAHDAPFVAMGDPVGYTITVTNAGPGTAYAVKVSDTLPTDSGLVVRVVPEVGSVRDRSQFVISASVFTGFALIGRLRWRPRLPL